ncbi:MAG: hypothetical protein QNJ69_07370 [Gammaproteobacteria bacterium]|nr:hypothetical protein [Gammaproteobacteria bacterium]
MLKSFESGFTLIELITIILLLSVLSVVFFGRLDNLSDLTDRGSFEETVAAVRYAQKLAVSTGCEVRVNLSGAGYALSQGDSCNSGTFTLAVMNPADRPNPYANPNISIAPADSFEFTPQSTVNNLGSDVTFTVNGDRTFRVYQFTALVDVP